jgi:hypothetical protein
MPSKIVALLFVMTIALSLAGCGGTAPETGPGEGPPLEPRAMNASPSSEAIPPLTKP